MQLKYLFLLFITKSVFISLVNSYVSLSQLTNPARYDATQMPQYTTKDGKSAPLNIIVDMKIFGTSERRDYQDDKFVINMDLKVELSWLDSRLRHNSEDSYIFTTDEEAIWTPQLELMTESDTTFTTKYISFYIYRDSTVEAHTTMEISLTRSYSQQHKNASSIRLMCVHHTTENLTLQWSEKNHFDYFHLNNAGFQRGICHTSVARIPRRHQGNYSCLDLYIEDTTSPAFRVYIPGIIAVMISWVCFWIAVPAVLENSAILTACLLHLIVQKVSIVKDLSLTENHQTINSWLDICIGFVLAAYFAVVGVTYLYVRRTRGLARRSGGERFSSATTIPEEEEAGIVEGSDGETNTQRNHFDFPRIWFNRFPAAEEINAICRLLFPAIFVLCLCVFFPVHYS